MLTVEVSVLAARLALALVLGTLIGAERQLRASTAGLRTTTLITVGAALFTLFGATAFPGSDPLRVSAQIVTGIGFIGAGVIIKHGSTISGLNTAATIWVSGAIGAFAGAGIWQAALLGSAAVILINSALRPLSRLLASTSRAGAHAEDTNYTISVTCRTDNEVEIRNALFDTINKSPLTMMSFSARDSEDGAYATMRILVHALQRNDASLEDTLRAVVKHPAVTDISWSASET
ncbi:MAG: MgtC/SapB family protein [Corynebacterium sp.]|uniref:MgtC/SapB family protein n=1 Tax=Corynebacterium sp. TaxID=1720 RepID=UPI0026DD4939|nr:MgtC/SapB family protein [Corynebacterium sp.]MDO5030047.1 MgtC/SapB family protein [Corynebacterium sp.]